MHLLLPITISLASLASYAAAYTLPYGLSDGVYAAFYNASGHEVHVKASDLAKLNVRDNLLEKRQPTDGIEKRRPSNRLEKRQDAGVEFYCGCGFNMNHGDCDAAVAALKAQFPAFVDGGVNFYSISSSVVAFVCNPEAGLHVDPGALTSQFQWITDTCGWYVAGTYEVDPTATATGYMIYYGGEDFCGDASGSSQHSC